LKPWIEETIMIPQARTILFGLFVLAVACPVHCGGGAGELSLDRAAITGLLESALPGPTWIDLPGLPELTVRIDAPRSVDLVDGGIETTLTLLLEEISWSGSLHVRYVPEVVRPEGIVTLRAESVTPELPVPVSLDLNRFFPNVPLPRSLRWTVEGPAGRPLELTCLVQSVEVGEERLVVKFGLLSGALRGPRDPAGARKLEPELQTFDEWLARNKSRIPLE
jgi:hypothetical protein